MNAHVLLFRLPTELLFRIFRCTLPDDSAEDEVEDPSIGLKLSHVCSLFRAIILQIPEAWRILEIFLHLPLRTLTQYVRTMVDRARGLSFRVIVREGPLKYCSWSTGEQDFRRLMRGAIKKITNVTFYNHSADPRNTRWFLNALRCIPHSVAIYELSDEQRYDLRGIKSVLGANSIKLRNATFIIWDSDMLACKELAFVGKVWHNATSLYAIFQQCPSLTKLTFDLPIPWNTGLVFHSPLPRLKELTIGSTKALVELNQVVPHFRFPTLVELKVGLCTPASLTNFLELHPTLRQVTLELSTNLISVEFLRRLSSDTPLFPTEEAFLDIESLHIDAWSIAVGLVAFNRLLRNGAFFGRQYGYSKPLTLTIKTSKDALIASRCIADIRWKGTICPISWSETVR